MKLLVRPVPETHCPAKSIPGRSRHGAVKVTGGASVDWLDTLVKNQLLRLMFCATGPPATIVAG